MPSNTLEPLDTLATLLDDRTFHLILLPTEACNFRCTYCYETFDGGRMKPETVAAVKMFLSRRAPDLHALSLSWFGGEPLLSRDTVLEVSKHAMTLASRASGLDYRAGMTTNGYGLTPDTVPELVAAGVLDYQITLDGPRDLHDRRRVKADGGGTFDRIWGNLLALRDGPWPIRVMLRVHFDADTLNQLDPLLDAIRQEFLPDARFSVHFKALARLGGAGDGALRTLSGSSELAARSSFMQKLYGEEKVGAPYICYAARPNSLMVRADGSMGKCTVALYDARNQLGTLQADGTVQVEPQRLAPWLRGLETLDPATLECPLVNLPS